MKRFSKASRFFLFYPVTNRSENHWRKQSASKHGRPTFLYSAMRELGMQRATLGKSGSKTASQLQGRTARAFSSNSLVKTMETTAAIQYILTATQSFGFQDYYKESRMIILGLAGILFRENEQA